MRPVYTNDKGRTWFDSFVLAFTLEPCERASRQSLAFNSSRQFISTNGSNMYTPPCFPVMGLACCAIVNIFSIYLTVAVAVAPYYRLRAQQSVNGNGQNPEQRANANGGGSAASNVRLGWVIGLDPRGSGYLARFEATGASANGASTGGVGVGFRDELVPWTSVISIRRDVC